MSHLDLLLGQANPVASLPIGSDGIDVQFEALTKDHCTWWHKYVQPHVDSTTATRADKKWRWPRLWHLQKLSMSSRAVLGAAMVTKSPDGTIPLGLCLLVTPYPHLVDQEKRSIFLWWLADMPKEAAAHLKIPRPGMIGAALLDYTLSLAFQSEFHGRVGLHAAPEGGARLAKWYKNDRKMKPVAQEQRLPGLRGRILGNDGRYFIYEPRESLTGYDLMNDWR